MPYLSISCDLWKFADKLGSIREVTDAIRSYGGRIVSMLTSYEKAKNGYRNVYIRAKGISNEKLS